MTGKFFILSYLSFIAAIVCDGDASAAAQRVYKARSDIRTREFEKVPLRRGLKLYLPKDQDKRAPFAPGEGGHKLLLAKTAKGKTLFATAELEGKRVYSSRRDISRSLGIRLSDYREKSVVAYLPSKDSRDPRPRYYTVIGPKSGKGPMVIERRPSQLLGGKPIEYSELHL